MDQKKKFYEIIKHEFAPVLRELGFKGSGQHFRRIYSPVMHAIYIQGNKYGGSCSVNMGVHLEFLPVTWSNNVLPDIHNIKEHDCEFRKRLAPKRRNDHWWKYDGGIFGNTGKSARNLIATYQKYGDPDFQQLITVDDIIKMLSSADITKKKHLKIFGGVVPVRAALTLARTYKHLGQIDKSAEYANIGLQIMRGAEALKPELEKLANPG